VILDQFQSLERVGSTIYVGFNDGIERVVFPKLVSIEGALVIEANPRLKEILFPNLVRVGRYLHINENAILERLELPKLAEVAGEILLADNPRLGQVKVASAQKPARAAGVELNGNGGGSFAQLYTVR
jgi:hypothetical protein